MSEAPNFGKNLGDNLFQSGAPKISGDLHIERPMFQNFGSIFCTKLYRYERANIDEMYHKSMYDP